MGYNDEIEVEYDTTGVPQPEDRGSVYSLKLSGYFYNKLNNINNHDDISGEDDFTAEEINTYNLDETDGKINISTTKKLVNYLKSLIKINVEKLDNAKLDKEDYVVDNELKNSSNPLSNSIIYNKFNEIIGILNNKSNLNHTHSIEEVRLLNNSMDLKADKTDLSNHTSNKNNPHGVNLSQLGFTDSGWDMTPLTQSSLSASDFPSCRKYGKMVILRFNAQMYKTFNANTTVFTLKTQYRPNHYVAGFAYKVGSGDCFTFSIETNGNLKFGTKIPSDTTVRIYVPFFTG